MSMKQFYLDTNVFISRLKPDDPYHSHARTMVEGLEEGELLAETSVVTLLEVASVSGRLYDTKGGKRSERGRKVFILKALQRLARLRTRFINMAGDTQISVKDMEVNLPSIINEAISLSLRTTPRTLDLIHLAAARHAKRMNNNLGAFVTGENEFLSNKKELSGIMGMPILSPEEYVDVLGL